MTKINGWACFFLVTLRLVIGWHFFIEGWHKVQTHWMGKTATNVPWTGEGFFREGYGPLAEWARKTLKIDVADQLSRFQGGQDAAKSASAHVEKHFADFAQHFQLTKDQVAKANEKYLPLFDEMKDWLANRKPTIVKSNVSWGVVERPMTVADRLANIRAALNEIDEIQNSMRPALGSEVEKARLRSLKVETARQIAELNAEYDDRLAALNKALESVLTDEQRKLGPAPTSTPTRPIDILDRITMWSQVILGLFLLLGLFSRLASFALALFLLAVTLIAPALPWAPTPPGAIGHYVYINLYTIEMIALLVLTSIPTGKWFGVDALIAALRGGRRPAAPARSIPVRLHR
jgi:uncharacterized membrane protein YphA (DoxX/SURF4 family)